MILYTVFAFLSPVDFFLNFPLSSPISYPVPLILVLGALRMHWYKEGGGEWRADTVDAFSLQQTSATSSPPQVFYDPQVGCFKAQEGEGGGGG